MSLRATARTSLSALSKRTTLFSLRTSAGALWLRPRALHRALSSDPMNPRSTAELKSKYSDVARARDVALRDDHHALKNDFPEHAFPPGQNSVDSDFTNRKRLIYRSKQRGWLEVDLLLGSFATKYVPAFTTAELVDYELILNQETLDIYNFIIGRDPLPEELDTPVMKTLQDFAAASPISSPSGYLKAKKDMSN